jgi:exopolysaccharide biosynthesis WecB/TagA/CpsF family protein
VSHHVPTIDILGVRVACLDPQQALDEASKLYERDAPAWIAVENAHALNIAYSDPTHRDVLNRADLVLNDGKGVLLAGRLLGRRFPADLHGNVFSPLLLERAAHQGWPVFFLGAAPGVVERAAATLTARLPDLQVVGTHDGFIAAGEEESVAEKIRSSGTGLLMVGMGMPLQEQWLDRYLVKTGARLGCTAGAFYDFQAGEIPRAPAWMNRMGLEWLYRLAQEPRRLWRRYLIGNPAFVCRVVGQRLRARR